MSPDSSDESDGSFDYPWKTLQYALEWLLPGDVLHLRGGTYYEHEMTTSLKGTVSAPITIQSHPGEPQNHDHLIKKGIYYVL